MLVHIHPQCGACNTLFLPEDAVVALLYVEKSIQAYDPSPPSDGRFNPEGPFFCNEPSNKRCYATDESVTIHADCLCLFRKTCSAEDKYRRLWIAATRMYPWRDTAPLDLDPVLYVPTEILSSAAGFPKSFLPDVAGLIGGHLELTHPLLRFCKVIQLAQYLSVAEPGNAVTHPLCDVLSWSRGASPILVEQGQAVNPWIRLTIDSRGIKSIERISDQLEKSTAIGLSLYSHVYIVEPVEKLSGVDVEFLLGTSRLHVPTSANVNIWNIPSPHVLPSPAHGPPLDTPLSGRFVALNLDPDRTTGLSFFLFNQKIQAIHGHTKRGSQALEAYQRLHSLRKAIPDWVYIPITANDKVISVGTVRTISLLKSPAAIRRKMGPIISYSIVLTMKSGKYFIGLSYPRSRAHFTETLYSIPQFEDRHLTLIHNGWNHSSASFIGADTVGEATSGLELRTDDPLQSAINCYESLERVVCAKVFSENESGKCRGILLEYEDGIKRTLGQCRLGFDAVRSYEHPTSFCYLSISYRIHEHLAYFGKNVYVAFNSETSSVEGQGTAEWEIHPMQGTLHFAYNSYETVINVYDA